MTKCIEKISDVRCQVKQWRLEGQSIAFVPTMGNLHAGHLRLVSAAKRHADKVVVSIFVNPIQFGEGEDFSSYPRTETDDLAKLQSLGVDVAFMPSIDEMYPKKRLTTVHVSQVSEYLCGAARPGHFDGVATVVCKLFNIVQPDKAFFGEKDFQQLTVLRTMVSDLNIPVELIAVATMRENDGLAMSSRNAYLSEAHRHIAPQLYQLLCAAKQRVQKNKSNYRELEKKYYDLLLEQGFSPDYFSICKQSNLQFAQREDTLLIILVAARIGKTRLIDNIQFEL